MENEQAMKKLFDYYRILSRLLKEEKTIEKFLLLIISYGKRDDLPMAKMIYDNYCNATDPGKKIGIFFQVDQKSLFKAISSQQSCLENLDIPYPEPSEEVKKILDEYKAKK
ncbi:MAG: hypothetical protein WCT18_00760 [Patescibacteria group bacterium]